MMEKMIYMLKDNNVLVPRLLLQNYKKFNISEKDLVVLIFLMNEKTKIFDPQKISNELKFDLTEVLETIEKLNNADLINISINKDNKIMEEIVELDNLYKKLAYLVVNTEERTMEKSTNIYDKFEEEFSRTLSPIEYELINGWIEAGFKEELIESALKEAIFNGVSNLRYIDKILYEWKKKGIHSIEDIKNDKEKFNKKKESKKEMFDYDWLNDETNN